MPDTLDLGGGTGNSFAFASPGDTVTGRLVSLEEQQQTDMDTGEPAFWPGGQPKMMYVVTLATDARDDAYDDGNRSIYLRGSRNPESKSILSAVLAAVRAATGGTALQVGGTLSVTYTGDGEATRRGFNPPKQYSATYQPPSVDLDQPAPPATQQPAQAAQAAQPPAQGQPPAQQPPAAPAAPQQPAQPDPAALMAALANLTPQQKAALGIG